MSLEDELNIQKEKIKAKDEVYGMLIDMLSKDGDKRFLLLKHQRKVNAKIREMVEKVTNDISDEEIDKYISILQQFEQIIDDAINENK